jgi:hypothetical protein
MTDPSPLPPSSFEEFKLFYESTERVTDRRVTASSTNYSICSATLAGVAVLLDWSLKRPSFLVVGLAAAFLLSAMAILFCSLWIRQIRDYKQLNNAKFSVLNDLAREVRFSESPSDARRSYEPFKKEWDFMNAAHATQRVGRSSLVALKASNLEFLIPRSFRLLFLILILLASAITARNWSTVVAGSSLAVTPIGGVPSGRP